MIVSAPDLNQLLWRNIDKRNRRTQQKDTAATKYWSKPLNDAPWYAYEEKWSECKLWAQYSSINRHLVIFRLFNIVKGEITVRFYRQTNFIYRFDHIVLLMNHLQTRSSQELIPLLTKQACEDSRGWSIPCASLTWCSHYLSSSSRTTLMQERNSKKQGKTDWLDCSKEINNLRLTHAAVRAVLRLLNTDQPWRRSAGTKLLPLSQQLLKRIHTQDQGRPSSGNWIRRNARDPQGKRISRLEECGSILSAALGVPTLTNIYCIRLDMFQIIRAKINHPSRMSKTHRGLPKGHLSSS